MTSPFSTTHIKRYLTTIIASGLICTLTSGCAALAIGGAAIGATSITDRRSTTVQANDQVNELRIQETALTHLNQQAANSEFKPKISVTSYNKQVLLLGLVASEADKQFVDRIARSQPDTKQVYNRIQVSPTERGILNVADDSWITSKVRTALLSSSGVPSNQVKVVTYNGVTYLMGILTTEEQQKVTQTVSTTIGVKEVVTFFQTFVPSSISPN